MHKGTSISTSQNPIKTGNIAVDMVSAAVEHYKKHGRTVKIANLSKTYWRIFSDYMKKQDTTGSVEIRDDGVQFNNLLVRRGTRFQTEAVKCELNPLIDPSQRN